MKIWMDYNIKEFEDGKVYAARDACGKLCDGCEREWKTCRLSSNDCPVRGALDALEGMIRVGTGIKRYKEIKGL